MKCVGELDVNTVFMWQNDLYVVSGARYYPDTVDVIRLATYWPDQERWVFNSRMQTENFNAYCEVETVAFDIKLNRGE